MRNRMQPVVVDGVLRPDLDHRWVTGSVLAQYLGVHRTTVYHWTLDGHFPPAAMRQFGGDTRYRPSGCVANGVLP